MSFVGLDVEEVRRVVAALRRIGDGCDDLAAEIQRSARLADLALAIPVQTAVVGDDLVRLARILAIRADLAEGLDVGPFTDLGRVLRLELEDAAGTAALEDRIRRGPARAFTAGPGELATRIEPGTAAWVHRWCRTDARYDPVGHLVGPDGLRYEVVIPSVRVADRTYSADWADTAVPDRIEDLGGLDPGWEPAGLEIGLDHVGAPIGAATAWAVAVALAAGMSGTDAYIAYRQQWGTAAPPEAYSLVHLMPGGRPHIGGTLATPFDLPAYEDGYGPAISSAELAIGIGFAIGAARRLDDERLVGYEIEYEVHPDGRRRALLRAVHLRLTSDGRTLVTLGHLAIDDDRHLELRPLTPRFSSLPFSDPEGVVVLTYAPSQR